MIRLQTELRRLFGLSADGLGPHQGQVRCLWIELAHPADWVPLRSVWQAVQTELDLPPPAIAVSGDGGLQLWLALAQPVPVPEAAAFVQALCRSHLPDMADLKPGRLRCWPDTDGTTTAPALVPAQVQGGNEPRWSAFVTPDLPAVFGADAWLDLPPGDDAQADLLSRIAPITPQAWAAARARLPTREVPPTVNAPNPNAGLPASGQTPVAFLRSVMNDAQAPLALRVEAARALLAAGLGDTA